MRIAFEVGVNAEGERGFEVYARGLIGGLAELDPRNEYHLYAFFYGGHAEKTARIWTPPGAPNFRVDVPRWPERLVNGLEYGLGLPVIDRLYARPRGIDLFHCNAAVPRLSTARTVVTAFDFIPEVMREKDPSAPWPDSAQYRRARATLLRAERVVVPSRATALDAMKYYGVPEERLTVTLAGVDHGLFKPGGAAEARAKYGLPAEYVLLIGPFEKRRNAERILEALAAVRKDLPVVLVGKKNDYYRLVEDKAAALGMKDNLRPLGFVPREDLPGLYSGALAFVHPSLWDGLGMPILEAMACGAPVITASSSGQREAGGDGALLVDPESTEAVARALKDVLGDPALRAGLSRRAVERAAKFTWRACAEKTLKVYEDLISSPR